MDHISKVTRRDILDLLRNGIEQESFFEKHTIRYPYYGRLDEVAFLERIFNFDSMSVYDSRCKNAKEDILRHTRNGDYSEDWVFDDERFGLMDLEDSLFLKFICEIFHPEVRDEKGEWLLFLNMINDLLKNDGFELYVINTISGRDLFGWKMYTNEPVLFIPFSIRNQEDIRNKKISLTISSVARYQIHQLLSKFDISENSIDEAGRYACKSVSDKAYEDIKLFYVPKNYRNNDYIEANNFEEFVKNTSPYCVLDVIESFDNNLDSTTFRDQINTILKLNQLGIKLVNGKISSECCDAELYGVSVPAGETGLEELLREAKKFYDEGDKATAVEKLWDAFERLKTYYSPTLDKKNSTVRIVKELAYSNDPMYAVFNDECKLLTSIGNNFRIRHHEKSKIEISEDLHYDYFYKRCMALISVALERLSK